MNGEERNRESQRRATIKPSERDTRMSGQLLEQLVQCWTRDASLVAERPGGGEVLAIAAEAAEFGLMDDERAGRLYEHAANHLDADPRAFAGLRRAARRTVDTDALIAAYRREAKNAAEPNQALLAGMGLAQAMIRHGRRADLAERVLREMEPLIANAAPDVVGAYRATLEDVMLAGGKPSAALQLRVQRWGELRTLGESVADAWSEPGALSIAVASEVVGADREAIREWYGVAFELARSVDALRPLLRACYDRQDAASAEALVGEVVEAHDDADVRARYAYELGMLRARRLGDRPGGLSALSSALKGSDVSPLVATTFLSQARAQQGIAVTNDLVDALGVGLDFAASGVERADFLTRLAARLEVDLGLTDEAIEHGRSALSEAPNHAPAIRLLGTLYARERRWDDLAALGETQLEDANLPASERLRLHERQADLYENELGDQPSAERHLRAALDIDCHLPVVRRMARLLAGQHRWEDLFDHFRDAAAHVRLERERLYLLERAGEVAEDKLRDPSLAIEVFRELLEVAPGHPAAISNLGRLYSMQQRWQELLALNELELELTPDDPRVRVAILCRSAEVSRRQLGDISEAEEYYRRALEEDPACGEALQGLGQILTAHGRWVEIVEMTIREMAHASDDAHRRRCLGLLGELHATHTGNMNAAVRCFEELAESDSPERPAALVWLDRLYQATDNPSARMDVLRARWTDAEDEASRARLAFRMAELLEWSLDSSGKSFGFYVESLAEPIAAPVALTALDRTWTATGVSEDDRRAALACVRDLAEHSTPALRRQALEFLVERGVDLLERDALHEAWAQLATEWPNDVRAAERVAVQALVDGDVKLAESVRAAAPAGPIELGRAHFAATDSGVGRHTVEPIDESAVPVLAGAASLEAGDTLATFRGVGERDTFIRMAEGHVALGELRHGDGTEAGARLAVLACRALEDSDGLRERWETVASNLVDPVRQLRAWLDLAAEDGFEDEERREWLRTAAALDCYHETLRSDLYDRMAQLGDYEGLSGAILVHLTQARPDAREAASLALRRARCLDMQGDRAAAVEALHYAQNFAPDDATVALEKARIETLDDDVEAARETISACLDAGATGQGRIDLLGRLADLLQMTGGDKQQALAALEDAYTLSEGAKEWGVRLASAHASFGRAERCVELLEAHLAEPPVADDVRYWQLLAKVYVSRLSAPDEASDILWMLFRSFPDRRSTLSGLEEFHKEHGGAQVLADGLGALLAESQLPIDQARAAKLWKYVGEINLSVLERMPEAEAAFGRARGLGDQSADAILRHAKAVARQPGRVRDAVPLLVDALEEGAGDATLWQDAFTQLEGLFEDMQMHGRLRVARQVRATLGANVSLLDDHIRRDPTRPLQASAAWGLLGSRMIDAADVQVLTACAPLADKVLAKHGPNRKSVRSRRLRREEFSAFDTFLDNACSWLEVTKPRVWVGPEGRGVRAFDSNNIWVPEDRIADSDPARARFWAGWTAGLLFSGLASFAEVDAALVDDFFRGVANRSDLDFQAPSSFDEEIGSLLLIGQRRAAASAVEAHPGFVTQNREWPRIAMSIADRAGLIVCGDLQVAVQELLVASGWDRKLENPRTPDFIVRDPRLRSLILYAIGDEHFLARYESGLAERPFLFA